MESRNVADSWVSTLGKPVRKLSIVLKLWLTFTVLILIVMIPLQLALAQLLTGFYVSQVRDPLLYHSAQLAHMLAETPESITIAPMMGQMVGGEVLILDRQGRPVDFPGASRLTPPPQSVAVARKLEPFAGQVQLPNGQQVILTAVPIPGMLGAVALVAPAEPMQRSLAMARRYLMLAGVGSLLLGTGLAMMVARSLVRPVLSIEKATEQIAQGDLSTRIQVQTGDEIGQLAIAVNQMSEQLESYENRRKEFLANVAHELRTPLAYIRGYAQAVSEKVVPTGEQDKYLRIIQEESVRLGRLVDDLMDLAQMDEGQLSFELQPLNLRIPIHQAVAAVEPLAREKGVKIHLEFGQDLTVVHADGGRLQQVVMNLLDNALRHTPTWGQITVSEHSEEAGVVVKVADTGPGIAPEDLPHVFERFHKRHSQGRGLGLAIVRSIIRTHGGEVGAVSEPGKGATFWFRLPVRNPVARQP